MIGWLLLVSEDGNGRRDVVLACVPGLDRSRGILSILANECAQDLTRQRRNSV